MLCVDILLAKQVAFYYLESGKKTRSCYQLAEQNTRLDEAHVLDP